MGWREWATPSSSPFLLRGGGEATLPGGFALSGKAGQLVVEIMAQ